MQLLILDKIDKTDFLFYQNRRPFYKVTYYLKCYIQTTDFTDVERDYKNE